VGDIDMAWNEANFQALIDAGLLEIGDGYRAKNKELGGTGPIFLRAGQVSDTHITLDGVERFHMELAAKVASKMSKLGDVVITTKGNSTGRTTFVTPELPPFVYSPHLSYWRSTDNQKLVPGFLRAWSNGAEFAEQLDGMKLSTDMAPYLSLTDQRRLRITLPPPDEQRAIAQVLGGLDDKIELNRRMNRTLEDLARGLFRSWFVDFDPVIKGASATAPAAPNPRVASPGGGLPIAQPLWPKRLIDSPLGPIPEGWRVGTVGELCAWIVSGGTPSRQKAEYWTDATIRWFKTGELTDGPLLEAEEKISQVGLDESACRLWQAGTVLFALYASPTLGRMGVLEEPGTSNQACAALWVKPEYGLGFLVQTLFLARDELQRISSGAAQQNINQGILRGHQVIVPSPDVAAEFSRIVNPWYKQQVSLARESCSLAALRDALLPQLLSGDIRLREAQRTIDDSLQANGQPLRAAQRAAARVKGSE